MDNEDLKTKAKQLNNKNLYDLDDDEYKFCMFLLERGRKYNIQIIIEPMLNIENITKLPKSIAESYLKHSHHNHKITIVT